MLLYKICMEDFLKQFDVSRETFSLLSRYVNVLEAWQAKMNLVSASSLKDVWQRHIADSYQLCQYLPSHAKTVCDVGSGAGFPAVVMAIWALENRPDLEFILIESITKKTVYLNDVKETLGLKNVQILNARAENLKNIKADVITARAVAELNKLFALTHPLLKMNTVQILPKGKSFYQELFEAKKFWNFDCDVVQNSVQADGVILLVSNLRKKK